MSTLRSALDELRAEDVSAVGDAALAGDLDEIERAGRVLEAERSRRLVEFERRGAFGVDGHLSVVSWLAARHGVPASVAAGQVRRARALEAMPAVAEAFGAGEVSDSAVSVLASAREAAPEAFARSEGALLEAIRTRSLGELRSVVASWRQSVERDGAVEEAERQVERRCLHLTPSLDGMVRMGGDLDPETGQTVITALRSMMDTEVRSRTDQRTPAQRRADALGELCRAWLDRSDRPVVAGERPHVVVRVDLSSLQSGSGRSELDDVGPVTPEAARRWACDANVSRVITDGRTQPLEVGRRTKVVPPPLRRAVAVRDGGCRFPGCGRPPGWCDAHHVKHWADGGETGLSNLVLLCRPHHRVVHNRRFGLEMTNGVLVFTRPDGTVLEGRAPP